jgi:hypothetical protein
VIDRGPIDWTVSNRSIESNNARPDERFAIVGRNLVLILKGSQMVAGGLTARAHPGLVRMRCFRSRRRSQIAPAVRCDPFRINNLARDNIRGCRFAQPPATFYNPYRGNEAMLRDNEVVNLSRNAWSE